MQLENNYDPALNNHIEARQLSKTLAGLIDAAIVIAAFILLAHYSKTFEAYFFASKMKPELMIFIFLIIYRLLAICLLKATIGMRICNIMLLNKKELPLTFEENFLAAFFILYKGVNYYRSKIISQ